MGNVTQERGGGYPREPSRATAADELCPTAIRILAAALGRTGTAYELEVPLGMGNSLVFEVTVRLSSRRSLTVQHGELEEPT